MKIIILAAGIGSRLGNPFPKPLTLLKDGKSIMQRQIDNITAYFDVNDITTVVGFKKNLIMEQFPEVNYVYNPFFDRTNTSKSLLSALKKHRGNSILWFNGDVVFDEQLLSLLLEDINNNQSFISVNPQSVAADHRHSSVAFGFEPALTPRRRLGTRRHNLTSLLQNLLPASVFLTTTKTSVLYELKNSQPLATIETIPWPKHKRCKPHTTYCP